MRASVLTQLILLAWPLEAIGQSPAQTPAASDNELKLVVALFRHGIRAPLPNFAKTANDYSRQPWPSMDEWKLPPGKCWGDLTTRGQVLATALGTHYATWYRKENAWPNGFKISMLADSDQRTIDTAQAVADGFQQGRIPKEDITVSHLPPGTLDSLFHAFKAGCGVPGPTQMAKTIASIDQGRRHAAQEFASSFKEVWRVLNCGGTNCIDLKSVVDRVTRCTDEKGVPRKCESPISWTGLFNTRTTAGQFPYASSASEAFLLEYANNMPLNLVGWGQVDGAKNLGAMLQLHEAYFRLTERESYLAIMQGSNLTREIRDLLSRTAEPLEPIQLECLRVDNGRQFIGLVGHDTNIAEVGKMLGLSWTFTDSSLPSGEHLSDDTLNLPADDALPAGAVVFELRQRAGQYFVRIEYVAQSLLQMRGDPTRPITSPFRFSVACHDGSGAPLEPCEMPWTTFKQLANNALGPDNLFLSRCAGGQQVCP